MVVLLVGLTACSQTKTFRCPRIAFKEYSDASQAKVLAELGALGSESETAIYINDYGLFRKTCRALDKGTPL